MAFWMTAAASGRPALAGSSDGAHRAAAGAARPLTYVLRPGAGPASPLTSSQGLVRLRVDVPLAAAAAPGSDDGDDDDGEDSCAAAQAAAVAAVGQLHQVIIGIEQSSQDACTLAVLEVLDDRSCVVLCHKGVVARVYKSLLAHQAEVGYTMAPVRACLSQHPVAAWDLQAALHTAVVKTLTGSSSGVPASNSLMRSAAADGDDQDEPPPAGQAARSTPWMCLSRTHLVGGDLLAATPGELTTLPFVELTSVQAGAGSDLLLTVQAAGSCRARLFSPMHALCQEATSGGPLPAPLSLQDTDASLLADPAKLSAAARKLHGRAVKLLPDERPAFIKSLSAAPTDPAAQQQLARWWLGAYGLQLPSWVPFLVGVASHHDAEDAQLQVPSCCVLTSLGLNRLPGSSPGGAAFGPAVQRLLADVQANAPACGFWGNRLQLVVKDAPAPGTGAASTQPGSMPDEAPGQQQQQPAVFTTSTQWFTAASADLQGAGQQGKRWEGLGALGLVEASAGEGASSSGMQQEDQPAAGQQPGSRAQGAAAGANKERWQGLMAYLETRQAEEREQQALAGGAASGSLPGLAGGVGGPKPVAAASAAPGARAAAPAPASTLPAAPSFASRRPGKTSNAPARSLPPAGPAVPRPALPSAAAGGAGAAGVPAAAAGAAPAGPPRMPTLGKRPAAANKAPAPAAAKKAKAAPKAAKPAAAAAAASSGQAAAAAAGQGGDGLAAAAAPSSAADQPQRKRTKAADMDAAAVRGKAQAALAASGGASLKGVSVPEMQCLLRAEGIKGGSAKRADVEARLLALLVAAPQPAATAQQATA